MKRPWDKFRQHLEAYISKHPFWESSSNFDVSNQDIDDSNFPQPQLLQASAIYPLICDLIKAETQRSPDLLSIFLGGYEEDFPWQIITYKIQELCRIYSESGRLVELFGGNWFDADFNQEFAIASIFTALNTESVLILDTGIYPDYNNQSFDLYTGYWQKNWQNYTYNHQNLDLQNSDTQNQSWQIFQENWLEFIPSFVEIFTCLQLDQHFLLIGLPPLLPQLFFTYFDLGSEFENLERLLATHYQNLCQIVSDNIYQELNLCLSLANFRDKSFAKSQLLQFLQKWFQARSIEFPANSTILEISNLVALIQPALKIEDWVYMQNLNTCLKLINTDVNVDANLDCRLNLMNLLYKEEFEFTVLRMNAQGQIRRSRSNRVKFFPQPLEPELDLEMVYIPSGIIRMGSPRIEVGHEPNESPMHWVALSAFFMGKFPVTQAQWYAIAQLPMVNKPLQPNPSEFQGDNHPVENISRHDAVEFCDRLKLKTGIQYRLPTEAEWEYACRAGTKTSFHFGDTITSEVVNYDGTYPYGFAAKGEYRQQTIEVGSFNAANDYGLYDMHGQVLEWCADPWHDDYGNAPTDGTCWEDRTTDENNDESNQDLPAPNPDRVLRGGSWFNVAGRCRAASRHRYGADIWLNHVGFRVALSS